MRTLLIGLTGADWKVMDPLLKEGAMPFLSKLMARGFRSDCVALAPHVPTLSWASALTGERPWKHGILEEGAVPLVPLLWDHLASGAKRSVVVGWSYLQHSSGSLQVPEPFFQTTDRHIRQSYAGELADDLADLQVTEDSLDPEVIRWLCPHLTPDEARLDPKAGRLARAVSILYSLHHTAASLLETETWDFASLRIPFLSHLADDFLSHQNATDTVPLAEQVRYQHLHRRSHQLLDLLLSELVGAAGKDLRVFIFSPHGLHGANSHGIFLAAGDGMSHGVRQAAVSVTDLMPSVMHSLGMLAPADTAGRVVNGLFDVPPLDPPSVLQGVEWVIPETKDPYAGWCLGVDLLDAGNPQLALPLLSAACDADPENPVPAYWLARCQFQLGRVDDARATCEVIRDHLPESQLCEYFLGVLALENGWYKEALKHLRKSKGIDESRTYEAVTLLGSGDLNSALPLLESLVSESSNAIAWFGLGRCRFDFGLYESAAVAAREAIAVQPLMADAWVLLAKSLERLDKKSDEFRLASSEAARLQRAMTPGGQGAARKLFSGNIAGSFSRSNRRVVPMIYRQPEEHEIERVDAVLRLPATPDATRWNRRIWQVETAAKRFAGAAIWRKGGQGEPASVHLKVLPRYLIGSCAPAMMDDLLQEVGTAGVTAPEVLTDRREPWEGILKERGFMWKSSDELWTGVDIRRALSRVRKSRLTSSARTEGWSVREVSHSDWETIRAWCVDAGYLPAAHFSQLLTNLDVYVSGVAESSDGIEGVLLATRRGMGHVIEFLGGHPHRKHRWPVVTWMLFERFGNPPEGGVPGDSATITTSPGKGAFARAMSIRLGGRLVDTIHRFVTHEDAG